MSIITKKLINAYTVLVIAENIYIEDVPMDEMILDNGSKSTLRQEVEVEVAKRTTDVCSLN